MRSMALGSTPGSCCGAGAASAKLETNQRVKTLNIFKLNSPPNIGWEPYHDALHMGIAGQEIPIGSIKPCSYDENALDRDNFRG